MQASWGRLPTCGGLPTRLLPLAPRFLAPDTFPSGTYASTLFTSASTVLITRMPARCTKATVSSAKSK